MEEDKVLKQVERLTELARGMFDSVQNQELPQEIMQVVKETYYRIEEVFKKYNSNPETTLEYAMSNIGYVNQVAKRVHESKIEKELQGIQALCKGIEKSIEDNLENQGERVKECLVMITTSNNTRDAERINENIEEWINDSMRRANRILYSRGADQRIIDAQTYDIRNLIRRLSQRNTERLIEAFKAEDEQLLNKLLEKYEIYEEQEKIADKSSDNEREKFVEELKKGAPTAVEQAETVEKLSENELAFDEPYEETKGNNEEYFI